MAKTYQHGFFMSLGNIFTTSMMRAGLKIGIMALLTVPGRNSGQPRTTPIAVVEQNGQRYLIAAFGIVQWVRNLRAAGAATLTRGRRAEAIRVVELAPAEAAPVLKAALRTGPGFTRAYFDATPDSPLADFEREALTHPVFLIQAM
jgi:deazaflavin-dependent oxidoreductase (nitroreductase family)